MLSQAAEPEREHFKELFFYRKDLVPPLLLSYPLMEISMKRKKWCKSNNIDEYIEKVLYKMITIFGDFINIYCVINNKPKKQNNKCIENCRESVLY